MPDYQDYESERTPAATTRVRAKASPQSSQSKPRSVEKSVPERARTIAGLSVVLQDAGAKLDPSHPSYEKMLKKMKAAAKKAAIFSNKLKFSKLALTKTRVSLVKNLKGLLKLAKS